MTLPSDNFIAVPTSTIVPRDPNLFIPYFTRIYEAFAVAINAKDNNFYTIPITDTAANIPGLPNFGSFIICISGLEDTLPTLSAALSKASSTASGTSTTLDSQAGTAPDWAAATLTITSTATNFQVNHSATGQVGNFNIRIIGTQ